ncbi:FadR/GntR family transcriptional regulator [Micromonospora sp. NPDC047707]|uniref:FadR/GntR family transcriptional regulator n=1 Tax=Micromonospora sp. NPDC047707 TaxID=3154498 RepID=UPI003452842B
MDQRIFEPIKGARLYESVVSQILELISRGEIPPGAQLPPERELADQLGVSRNVLREAFRVLEVRGIVHSRAGGGRTVRPDNVCAALPAEGVVLRLEQAVISDVLESRELLEVQVARLAAVRASDEHIQALRRICDGDDTSWAANVAFHTAVAAATGNFMLERLIRLQMDLLDHTHQRDHYRSPNDALRGLNEHRAIANAIAARDPDAAETTVRYHFRNTRTAVGQ